MPPMTAASGVPPEAIVAIARNCAPPAKITSDITHVIGSETPPVRASTPNEIPIRPEVAAKMAAARQGLAGFVATAQSCRYGARDEPVAAAGTLPSTRLPAGAEVT